jgi:hypothetical protein
MKINLAVFEYNEKNKAINKVEGKKESTKSVLDDLSLERDTHSAAGAVMQDLERIEADVKSSAAPAEKKQEVVSKVKEMKSEVTAATDKKLSKKERAGNMKELLKKLKGTKDFMKINLAVFEYNEKNKAINKVEGKKESTKSVLDDLSLERDNTPQTSKKTMAKQHIQDVITDIEQVKEKISESDLTDLEKTQMFDRTEALLAHLSSLSVAKTTQERSQISKQMKGELKSISNMKNYFNSLERDVSKKPSDDLKQALKDLEVFQKSVKGAASSSKMQEYIKSAKDDAVRLATLPSGVEKDNVALALNIRMKALKDMNSKSFSLERDEDTPQELSSTEGQAKIKLEVEDVMEQVRQSNWKAEVKSRVEKHGDAILNDLEALKQASGDTTKLTKLSRAIKLRMAALEKLKSSTVAPEVQVAPAAPIAVPTDNMLPSTRELAAALAETPQMEKEKAAKDYQKNLAAQHGDGLAANLATLSAIEGEIKNARISKFFKTKALDQAHAITEDLRHLAGSATKADILKAVDVRIDAIRKISTMARIPGADKKIAMFPVVSDLERKEAPINKAIKDIDNIKAHLMQSERSASVKQTILKEVDAMKTDLERMDAEAESDGKSNNLKKALAIRMKRLKKLMAQH